MNIKRFVETKCIGYSRDFSTIYFKALVEMNDGKHKVLYSSTTTDSDGSMHSSEWIETIPYVAILQK